mmetsp:Transcript_73204/g.210246  ORF Transcript_73204/g.210246 Transcript_73204/m.210246 type:complete len:246 (+) Transcript_73204:211-948(+)
MKRFVHLQHHLLIRSTDESFQTLGSQIEPLDNLVILTAWSEHVAKKRRKLRHDMAHLQREKWSVHGTTRSNAKLQGSQRLHAHLDQLRSSHDLRIWRCAPHLGSAGRPGWHFPRALHHATCGDLCNRRVGTATVRQQLRHVLRIPGVLQHFQRQLAPRQLGEVAGGVTEAQEELWEHSLQKLDGSGTLRSRRQRLPPPRQRPLRGATSGARRGQGEGSAALDHPEVLHTFLRRTQLAVHDSLLEA